MMRLNRKQLRNILLKEVNSLISETDDPDYDKETDKGPPYDIFRREEIRRVFGDLDPDWWTGDSASIDDVQDEVGENALKSLGEFLKKDPAWKAWYSKLADDGTGGRA